MVYKRQQNNNANRGEKYVAPHPATVYPECVRSNGEIKRLDSLRVNECNGDVTPTSRHSTGRKHVNPRHPPPKKRGSNQSAGEHDACTSCLKRKTLG